MSISIYILRLRISFCYSSSCSCAFVVFLTIMCLAHIYSLGFMVVMTFLRLICVLTYLIYLFFQSFYAILNLFLWAVWSIYFFFVILLKIIEVTRIFFGAAAFIFLHWFFFNTRIFAPVLKVVAIFICIFLKTKKNIFTIF